ncbi:DUF2935 domain-containing protein [Effusibacillus consociatus]|uniref:DUF2935 domain-containing protein n=1 Tax=Effusibacillus consociatus TaxID=1117041 RepID=A0ABV9Q8X4_9BACL
MREVSIAMAGPLTPWEEHHFWLEILEDHAHFARDFLSPIEQRWVQLAIYYIGAFRGLRQKLLQVGRDLPAASPQMVELAGEIVPVATGYYQFESELQRLRLQNRIHLGASPSYFDGTLLENREYLRLLAYYVRGEDSPPLSFVDLLDMWLEDQIGHAVLLRNGLDPAEVLLVQQSQLFVQTFQSHLAKHEAIKKFILLNPFNLENDAGRPVINRFAIDVTLSVNAFYEFVQRVVELHKKQEVMNRVTLRFLEHHFPETCYFLNKLFLYVPQIRPIPCTLSKPSFR